MARKTIAVRKLLDMANHYLEQSPEKYRAERLGVASFITDILLKTDNYSGFRYLKTYGTPECDETRVYYYRHRNLRQDGD